MAGLCPAHQAEHMKWLDWIGTPSCQLYAQGGGITIVQIGVPRADRIEEARRARAERVYALVREQQTQIRADCTAGKGCATLAPE